MTAVTLFGTRGSIAAPGPESVRYGGNTSTVQVLGDDGTVLVLDAGTGIRRLGAQLPPGTERVDIVLTHLHMDHIQGLGFFGPLYDPDVEVQLTDDVFVELDEEYAALERQIRETKSKALKPLEDRLNTIKATLKRAIGSGSKATLKNGTVYTLKTITKEPYMATPKPYNLIRRRARK